MDCSGKKPAILWTEETEEAIVAFEFIVRSAIPEAALLDRDEFRKLVFKALRKGRLMRRLDGNYALKSEYLPVTGNFRAIKALDAIMSELVASVEVRRS